jgi:tRNA modification GTPase
VAFTLVDTAGVEGSNGDPLMDSVRLQADSQAKGADLLVLCLDSTRRLHPWEIEELERIKTNSGLVLLTKTDLPRCSDLNVAPDVVTSVPAKQGLDEFVALCRERLEALTGESNVVPSTAVRCRESLRMAGEAVCSARQLAVSSAGDELIAAEVRTALECLGEVVGAVYTDDVLDRVFSRFCIGK